MFIQKKDTLNWIVGQMLKEKLILVAVRSYDVSDSLGASHRC